MTEQPPEKPKQARGKGNEDIDLSEWFNPSLLETSTLLRVLLVLLITICLLWLAVWVWLAISYFAGLLLLFMSAWLIALMLTPLVRYIIKMGLPKGPAIGLSYILVIMVIGLFIALVVPGLISQTQVLIANTGPLTSDLQSWLNATAKNLGIGPLNLSEVGQQFQGFVTDLLKNALAVATGLAGFLLQILLVLIISASLLAGQRYTEKERDLDRRNDGLRDLISPRWRRFGLWVRLSLERNFGVFLGGQLVVGVIYGIVVAIVMLLAGLPYAVTTACICGVMMLIPLFGGPLSLLPPLIVAISSTPEVGWFVLPVLFVIQTALLNVVLPKIVGQRSGVGPVATLFVLLAGAQIGGVWGVLLGVPLAGVVVSVYDYLLSNSLRRESPQPKVEVKVTTDPEAHEVEVTTVVKAPVNEVSSSSTH